MWGMFHVRGIHIREPGWGMRIDGFNSKIRDKHNTMMEIVPITLRIAFLSIIY